MMATRLAPVSGDLKKKTHFEECHGSLVQERGTKPVYLVTALADLKVSADDPISDEVESEHFGPEVVVAEEEVQPLGVHVLQGDVGGREDGAVLGLEQGLGEEAALVTEQLGELAQPVTGLPAFFLHGECNGLVR